MNDSGEGREGGGVKQARRREGGMIPPTWKQNGRSCVVKHSSVRQLFEEQREGEPLQSGCALSSTPSD